MPNQVHGVLLPTMSDTELSRVRTELERPRILTAIPPHPVQANRQPAPHRYLGNAPVPTHRQVHVPTSPLRIASCCRLGGLHQQEAQQGVALFADVPQPLLASTGVLTRNHPHVRADLLAAVEPLRSSDDQHIGECRQWAYTGMRHQPQHVGSLLASCSTAAVSSSMVGLIRSSNSNSSCRRRLAQGANASFSNCARPCSLNSFFFQR